MDASLFQEDRLRFELYADLKAVDYMQAAVFVRFDIEGPLRVAALAQAFATIVRRHAILRTGFMPMTSPVRRPAAVAAGDRTRVQAEPLIGFAQIVEPEIVLRIHRCDLTGLRTGDHAAAIERLTADTMARRFDYHTPPLIRVTLATCSPSTHVLIVGMSRLVSDGWSWKLLERELWHLYGRYAEGAPADLPALPIQFADFAAWQHEHVSGEVLTSAVTYWKRQLGAEPLLNIDELPFVHPSLPSPSADAASRECVSLSAAACGRLKTFARDAHLTMYAVMLAALAAVLHRATRRGRIAVVGHTANRARHTQDLIGPFAHLQVLSIDCAGDPSLAALLERVRTVIAEAIAHQDVPWVLLSRMLGDRTAEPGADSGPSPYVDFAMTQAPRIDPVEGLSVTRAVMGAGRAESALTIAVHDGATLEIEATYATARCTRLGVRQLLSNLTVTLDRLLVARDTTMSALPLSE